MDKENISKIVDLLLSVEKTIHNNSKLSKYEKYIKRVRKNVSTPLQVMFMGEYSTGKSTVINALIGKKVTTVSAREETGVITKLVYGDKESIQIFYNNGTKRFCNKDEYRNMSSLSNTSCKDNKDKIAYIEYTLPIEFLKNISIIDSPGINSNNSENAKITENFIYNADMVLWITKIDSFANQDEMIALTRLSSRLKHVVVVNMIDLIDEEDDDLDDLLEEARKKYKENVKRIIGISAEYALEGKLENDDCKYQESNFKELEEYIEQEIIPHSNEYKFNSLLDGLCEIIMYMVADDINYYFMQDIVDYVLECCHKNILDRTPSENLFVGEFSNRISKVESDNLIQLAADEGNILARLAIMAESMTKKDVNNKSLTWINNINEENIENIEIPYIKQLCYDIIATVYYKKSEKMSVSSSDNDGNNNTALNKAKAYYEKSYKTGSLYAATQLANIYMKDEYHEYEMALSYYNEAAIKDYSLAQYYLGYAYYEGKAVEKNIEIAIEWMEKSARNGSFDAMEFLSLASRLNGVSDYYNDAKSSYWLDYLIKERDRATKKIIMEASEKKNSSIWLCVCGEENKGVFCMRCGRVGGGIRKSTNKAKIWMCQCGKENKGFFCMKCGRGRN